MTTQEYNKLSNEHDNLNGNINRMFVTDDYGEFEAMYSFAKSRLETLYAELFNIKFTDDED